MIPTQLQTMRFNRVRFKDKRALEKGWQNKPYSYNEINKFFPQENYGVLCGKELRVLDDDTEKKGLIKIFIDNFGETFRVRDHLYFKFDNEYNKKIIFMNGKYHLGELQGEGTYVVGAGSTHPSGDIYEQKNELDIITISYDKFVEVFGEFIKQNGDVKKQDIVYNYEEDDFIKSIKDKWEVGNRQELAMEVSGYLRKNKRLGLDSCLSIVEGIARDCNDEEISQRLNAVRSTYEKDEKDIKGISGLKERGIIKQPQNVFTNRISQAEIYHKENPFFNDENKIWGTWCEREFKWKKGDEIEILGKIYNNGGVDIVTSKERTEITNALKHVGRFNQPKPIKNSWIQYKERIFDVETGEDFEASPEWYVTNPISYSMGGSEETPMIDELFASWVGEDHKQELYEIIAFAQAPEYFIHRIICLIGSGANGKSTYLSLMRRYLGDDNVVSSSLEALMKVRFEGSKLYKKLVCLMGETNFGTLTQTDYIKGLSGGDKMRIEFKGKDGFDAVNYAKLILATNSLPTTADKTDGFYRRWKIINFNNTFKKEKNVLEKIPEEEYNNLARKCFRILQELWKDRIFTNDGNFEERKANYEKHSNPLSLFLEENFEKDVNADYPNDEFREQFLVYLEDHGFRELTPKTINQQLQLNGFEVKQIKRGGVNRRRILGIKSKKVTEVTKVTENHFHFPCIKQTQSSVTSVTCVTDPKKTGFLCPECNSPTKETPTHYICTSDNCGGYIKK